MATIEMKRCDNLSCVCETPIAEATCSEYCAKIEHGDEVSIRCECGHASCSHEMELELTGAMGTPQGTK